MAMQTPPVEDVFPIKTRDFPASHVGNLGSVGFWWPWKGIAQNIRASKTLKRCKEKTKKTYVSFV